MEAFLVRYSQLLRLWASLSITLATGLAVQAQTPFDRPVAKNPIQQVSSKPAASIKLPPGARGPYDLDSLRSGSGQVTPIQRAEEFESAKIIARVGDDVILAGDLMGQINQFLHNRLQQIPAEQRSQIDESMLDQQRAQLMRQLLPQSIEGKLLYLDFRRSIPQENLPDIEDSLFEAFDEQQLPTLVERANVQTAADLDKLFRSFGSSLNQQRQAFAEQLAAAQWKQRNTKNDREISHDDLVSYYREHLDDYRIKAKCRWEQLTARNDETGSKQASYKMVAQMGNEVHYGASFEAVAKRSSQGPTASQGGKYDWTTRGSLRSTVLEKAIFELPIGSLSSILSDRDGCHIVRVTERQEEGFVPFAEAQDGIREKIEKVRGKEAFDEYIAKLRAEFPVWTVLTKNSNLLLVVRSPHSSGY